MLRTILYPFQLAVLVIASIVGLVIITCSYLSAVVQARLRVWYLRSARETHIKQRAAQRALLVKTWQTMRIGIVIPARNEAANIRRTLQTLDEHAVEPSSVTVVVVDAGSSDGTAQAARSTTLARIAAAQKSASFSVLQPVRVISVDDGRAAALNAGAAVLVAGGEVDVLLFLHADTLLPPGYDVHVRKAAADEGTVVGAFQFHVDRSSFSSPAAVPVGLGVLEAATNFRARHLQLPYGDQALFLSMGRWRQLGPYPLLPLMEDFDFMRHARRVAAAEASAYDAFGPEAAGFAPTASRPSVHILPVAAACNGRRWEMNGLLWNTVLNQIFIAAHTVAGVSADTLHAWYYGRRPAAKAPATAQATPASATGTSGKRRRAGSLANGS